MFDVATCNDIETLKALYRRNEHEVLGCQEAKDAVNKRKAELASAVSSDPGEGKITDNQRKAIMAYYKNMTREERLKDMSAFQGRGIESFNELTFNEAHAFIDATNQDKAGAQA